MALSEASCKPILSGQCGKGFGLFFTGSVSLSMYYSSLGFVTFDATDQEVTAGLVLLWLVCFVLVACTPSFVASRRLLALVRTRMAFQSTLDMW